MKYEERLLNEKANNNNGNNNNNNDSIDDDREDIDQTDATHGDKSGDNNLTGTAN